MSKQKVDWVTSLKKFVKSRPQRSEQQIQNQTKQLCYKYVIQAKTKEAEIDPSFRKLGKFFQKRRQPQNLIAAKIWQEARYSFLAQKTAEILDNSDFKKLIIVLKENVSPPHDNTQRLNYNSFKTVSLILPLKFRQFFTALTFMNFDKDDYGRIDMQSFFHSIIKKNELLKNRIKLAVYDTAGKDYLTEDNLKNYISELIPTFIHLKHMDEGFKDKYIQSSVRRFFFFLDPRRNGRIYIKDILLSESFEQLSKLGKDCFHQQYLSQNWFSIQYLTELYKRFCWLDSDKCGLLKKQDLAKYSKTLPNIVIDRIFEQFPGSNGRMDYNGFLQFVLAIENKHQLRAIQYFWRVLDVYHKGAIDSFIINMFFRSIIQKLQELQSFKALKTGELNIQDIKDEIFDMAEPQLPMAITLKDMMRCKQADKIVSLLIDAKAFYDHAQSENAIPLDFYDDY